MSSFEQFWQYADEAFRRADQSENEKERQALLDLARTWTQAAIASESTFQSAERSSAPYRIYSIGAERHIAGPADVVECSDDQEAIQKAQQAVNGKDVELWEGSRFIVRFPSDEAK